MSEIVVLVGLPASGKSTFAKRYFSLPYWVIVSKDQMRNSRGRHRRQMQQIQLALYNGLSVVVDNTNPSVEFRADIINMAKEYSVPIRAIFFDISFDTCWARNAKRTGRELVPGVGIKSIARDLVRPTTEEGFDNVAVIDENDQFRRHESCWLFDSR